MMLGSADREHPRLILTSLSKNYNKCDHNPPTLQTDRHTDDGQTTCHNTALFVASRGNKTNIIKMSILAVSHSRLIQF